MATDCEKLSPNAQKIFARLKPHFPPDPWNNPMWREEGIVRKNLNYDLRKHADRGSLIDWTTHILGTFVENAASGYSEKLESLHGFEKERFGLMIAHSVELLLILRDLDFQIETTDLADPDQDYSKIRTNLQP